MEKAEEYEKNTVFGLFARTVDILVSAVDSVILTCEFSDAEGATIRMQETLNSIVDAMVKHKHCTSYEATVLKGFIGHITADKKKIISNKRYIRALEYHASDDIFKDARKKWEEYTTTHPFDESHTTDSNDSRHNSHRWEPDDGEENL